MDMLASPFLVDEEKERGKGRGKSTHPFTPAQELLNGITYDGWWRMRERKRKGGGKLPFWEKKMKTFEIYKASF
jgi:hypothetical protein